MKTGAIRFVLHQMVHAQPTVPPRFGSILVVCGYVAESSRQTGQHYIQMVEHNGDSVLVHLGEISQLSKETSAVPNLPDDRGQMDAAYIRQGVTEALKMESNIITSLGFQAAAVEEMLLDGTGHLHIWTLHEIHSKLLSMSRPIPRAESTHVFDTSTHPITLTTMGIARGSRI